MIGSVPILLYVYYEKNFKINVLKIPNKPIAGKDSRKEQFSLLKAS